jgi:D-erythronate 2-dehydrogenase
LATDPLVQQIGTGWPPALSAPRALALGFTADADIDAVVRAFIEDRPRDAKALGLGR